MSKLSLPAVDPALVDSQLSWDQDYPAPFVEPCRLVNGGHWAMRRA